eukprot:GSChrysophyteH1.ASY1.ANO1.3199.1 assembled CDS
MGCVPSNNSRTLLNLEPRLSRNEALVLQGFISTDSEVVQESAAALSRINADEKYRIIDKEWVMSVIRKSCTCCVYFGLRLLHLRLQTFAGQHGRLQEYFDSLYYPHLSRDHRAGSDEVARDTDRLNTLLESLFLGEDIDDWGLHYLTGFCLWRLSIPPDAFQHYQLDFDFINFIINDQVCAQASINACSSITVETAAKILDIITPLLDRVGGWKHVATLLTSEQYHFMIAPGLSHLYINDIMQKFIVPTRMPELAGIILQELHSTGADPKVMARVLRSTRIDAIPRNVLELLVLGEERGKDSVHDRALGTAVLGELTGSHKLTTEPLISDDKSILRQLFELFPELKTYRGVTCSLNISPTKGPYDHILAHPAKLRDLWRKNNLLFADPTLQQLRVRAQVPVTINAIAKLVKQQSFTGEVNLQAYLAGHHGIKECRMCKGTGCIDLFANATDEELALEEREIERVYDSEQIEKVKEEFCDAFLNCDMKALRIALKMVPSLAPITRLRRNKEGRNRQRVRWMYSDTWHSVQKETKQLPYGGDIQEAMRNRDRQAIREIMDARKAPGSKPVHSTEIPKSDVTWIKFDQRLGELIESAYGDSHGSLVQIYLPEEGVNVQINCEEMSMVDEETKKFRLIHREIKRMSEEDRRHTEEPCWVCKGAGRTSEWMDPKNSDKINDDAKMCLVCYASPGKYGMSVECEHLFCEECLTQSLKAMLNLGQFPAFCSACRAESQGVPPRVGKITRPVMTFLQERGLLTKGFQFRFVTAMLRVGDADTEPVEESEIIECPRGCGTSLYAAVPTYSIVAGRSIIKLVSCPCGAKFCIKCMKIVVDGLLHECDESRKKRKIIADKADQEAFALAGKIGKKCPVCRMFIEKDEGCEWMMCGAASHGKLADALRNGGCGIAFNWNDLSVRDDPCGYKDMNGNTTRGKPMTARQFPSGYIHPKCKRPGCRYLKCTDGMMLPHHHGVKPSNGNTDGEDYCCKGCKTGEGHTQMCHRILSNDPESENEMAMMQLESQSVAGEKVLTKYFIPFDAQYLRFIWRHDENSDLTANRLDVHLEMEQRITGVSAKHLDSAPFRLFYRSDLSSPWTQYDPKALANHLTHDPSGLITSRVGEVRGRFNSEEFLKLEARRESQRAAAEMLEEKVVKSDAILSKAAGKLAGAKYNPEEIIAQLSKAKEKINRNNLDRTVGAFMNLVAETMKHIDNMVTGGILTRNEAEWLEEKASEAAQDVLEGKLEGEQLRKVREEIKSISVFFDRVAVDKERQELCIMMQGALAQCPACGFPIEKISGDDTMMCGCEARPAGGTLEKALASGGCGHEFHFATGAPLGTGAPYDPANDRQWKFMPFYQQFAQQF